MSHDATLLPARQVVGARNVKLLGDPVPTRGLCSELWTKTLSPTSKTQMSASVRCGVLGDWSSSKSRFRCAVASAGSS